MRIAIFRSDGIGDLVLTLPMASALKRHLPSSTVIFLISKYQAPLIRNHPDVDEIGVYETIDKRAAILSLEAAIEATKPQVIIDLLPRPKTAWTFFKHKIPIRIGTAYRWWSLLYNRRVKVRKHRSDRHEAEFNLQFLRPLGIENPQLIPPRLYLTDEELQQGRKRVSHLAQPRVIVHPGSHGTSPNWPVELYAELVNRLLSRGISVIVTGSKREREEFGSHFAEFEGASGYMNLMGKTDLREVMAVIAASDLVVSCGTGVMHIAAALRVPTISLFGSNPVVGPSRWGPLGNRSKVLSPLDDYTPEDMEKAIIELMRSPA